MITNIFVNLPVKDLNKTVEFFTKLGFTFNPQFSDENATCMIVGKDIFVMLLVEKFFKTFTKKEISDTTKNTEAIVALSAQSREEVDRMMEAEKLEIHRIMDGCMDVVLKILMDIFGKYFTWMKVP